MGLVTRQGKGSKLTVQEMDGNLEYLRGSYKVNTNGYIDWSEASMQEFNVTGDVNFDFVGAVTGQELTLLLNQSSGNIGWTSSVKWVNDVAPVITNGDVKLDTTFVTGSGFNDFVITITLQSDGKILVGGNFGSYNGVSIGYGITRLNTNGTLDNTFLTGTGFNYYVRSIVLQSDGKILVGGDFNEYNGASVGYMTRLNSDGSLDTAFDTGTGFNGAVFTITLQSDGKILVGGFFTEYDGVSVGYMTRLNSDGSLDTSFVTGTGFNNSVYSVVLQSDGKILVGGGFTEYNGVSIVRIARLNSNGSLDTTFVTGTGFNNWVYSVVLQSGGKILVGGQFGAYNGISVGYITRLNSDGSLDTTFVTGTGFNSDVYSVVLQSDGKILVGGWFNEYNGISVGYIARLNTDGSLDTAFVTGSGFNGDVRVMTLQSDGNILVGGFFTEYNGVSVGYMTRLSQLPTYKVVKFYYNGVNYIGESINQVII